MPADSSIDWASAPGSFPNVAPMSFQLICIEVWDCKHGTGPGSQRGSGHVQARGIGTLGLAQTGGAQESGAAMWLRGAPQTEGQTRCVHMETRESCYMVGVCARAHNRGTKGVPLNPDQTTGEAGTIGAGACV